MRRLMTVPSLTNFSFLLARSLNMSVILSMRSVTSLLAWYFAVSSLTGVVHLRNRAIAANHCLFFAEGDVLVCTYLLCQSSRHCCVWLRDVKFLELNDARPAAVSSSTCFVTCFSRSCRPINPEDLPFNARSYHRLVP